MSSSKLIMTWLVGESVCDELHVSTITIYLVCNYSSSNSHSELLLVLLLCKDSTCRVVALVPDFTCSARILYGVCRSSEGQFLKSDEPAAAHASRRVRQCLHYLHRRVGDVAEFASVIRGKQWILLSRQRMLHRAKKGYERRTQGQSPSRAPSTYPRQDRHFCACQCSITTSNYFKY